MFWPLCLQEHVTVDEGELQWKALPHVRVLAFLMFSILIRFFSHRVLMSALSWLWIFKSNYSMFEQKEIEKIKKIIPFSNCAHQGSLAQVCPFKQLKDLHKVMRIISIFCCKSPLGLGANKQGQIGPERSTRWSLILIHGPRGSRDRPTGSQGVKG